MEQAQTPVDIVVRQGRFFRTVDEAIPTPTDVVTRIFLSVTGVYCRWSGTTGSSFQLGGPFGPRLLFGSGSPEGIVTGYLGDIYLNQGGGPDTTLWVKQAGNPSATGWIPK